MILQSQSINQWQNVSDICACEHEAIDWFMSCSLDISKEKKKNRKSMTVSENGVAQSYILLSFTFILSRIPSNKLPAN